MCKTSTKKRICFVVTQPAFAYMFARDFLTYLNDRQWDITIITAPQHDGFGTRNYDAELHARGAKMVYLPMQREPNAVADLLLLIRLWWFFLWHRFNIVHASHPKTMLLGTIAAFLAFVPKRIVTVRGRAYENFNGKKRKFYIMLDCLTCFLAKKVIVVSPSLRTAMINDNIAKPESLIVIKHGSSQGCNTEYFSREQVADTQVQELRTQYRLPPHAKVILFAGRVRADKGVIELVEAFAALSPMYPDWYLVMFGHEETASDIGDKTRDIIKMHPAIRHYDWSHDLRIAYKMADIFSLPTWREGFPNTVLEASAMQLPVITTDAVGAIDSVVDGITGYVVQMQNSNELQEHLQLLIENTELRTMMGREGCKYVCEHFQPNDIWTTILEIYETV